MLHDNNRNTSRNNSNEVTLYKICIYIGTRFFRRLLFPETRITSSECRCKKTAWAYPSLTGGQNVTEDKHKGNSKWLSNIGRISYLASSSHVRQNKPLKTWTVIFSQRQGNEVSKNICIYKNCFFRKLKAIKSIDEWWSFMRGQHQSAFGKSRANLQLYGLRIKGTE